MSSTRFAGIRPALPALLIIAAATLAGCTPPKPEAAAPDPLAMRITDREAIEDVLARVNRAFELGDAEPFANGFAEDAVFELEGKAPVFGYQKMRYEGRDQIRQIVTDRMERQRNADPKTLSYDPASLRRYNRNSDSRIEIVDATHAKHSSTWMVVMKTNVDIHTSAIGRYEDELEKKDSAWLITKRRRIE